MKNDVAPIIWSVQFISPPSDIVDVEMQKRSETIDEIGPKIFSFGLLYPKIS